MKVGSVVMVAIAIAVMLTYYWHRSSKPKYPTYPKIDGISGFEKKPTAPPPSAQANLDWQLDQLLKENPYLQQNQKTTWYSVLSFGAMTSMVLLMGYLAAGRDGGPEERSEQAPKNESSQAASAKVALVTQPANPEWPHNTHVAVCISLVLDDEEYGLRFGLWPLLRILGERSMPATIFAPPSVLSRSPDAVRAILSSGSEVGLLFHTKCSSKSVQTAQNLDACRAQARWLEQLCGAAPKGLMVLGSGAYSLRRAAMATGLFAYDASPAGDLPFYAAAGEARPHLVVPSAPESFQSACERFMAQSERLSNVKRPEGDAANAHFPTPCLHAPLFKCSAAAKVDLFLEAQRLENLRDSGRNVWYCTRQQAAAHWSARHPPLAGEDPNNGGPSLGAKAGEAQF